MFSLFCYSNAVYLHLDIYHDLFYLLTVFWLSGLGVHVAS